MSETAESLFEESGQLSAAGDIIGSRTKLEQASQLGHLEANYRLAICESVGFGGPQDTSVALQRLAAIADVYPPARIFESVAVASGWSGNENWAKAIGLIVTAAKNADPAALFDTAMLCLLRDSTALAEQAQLCLTEALKKGAHYAAPALMRLHALQNEKFVPPQQILSALEGARYVPIGELLRLASSQTTQAVAATGTIDFEKISAALASPPENWLPQEGSALSAEINARSYHGAIHPCICDFIIGNAGPALRQAQVFDPETGSLINHRTRQALQAGMQPYMQTLLSHALERVLCRFVSQPWQHAERLTILMYRPGDYYAPHADYFSEGTPEDDADVAASGQRAATALICLHPAPDGGATHFPHLNVSWQGNLGDILTFENLNAVGAPNPLSLHEGQKVNEGWKSLASLWVRTKPYRGPIQKAPGQPV